MEVKPGSWGSLTAHSGLSPIWFMCTARPARSLSPAVSHWWRRFILVTKVGQERLRLGQMWRVSTSERSTWKPVYCSHCLQLGPELIFPDVSVCWPWLPVWSSPLRTAWPRGLSIDLAADVQSSNPFSTGDHPVAFCFCLAWQESIEIVAYRGYKNEFIFLSVLKAPCVKSIIYVFQWQNSIAKFIYQNRSSFHLSFEITVGSAVMWHMLS